MSKINRKFLKNITVLYVEDDDLIREEVSSFCKQYIKNFYCVNNADEGIKLFSNINPDLIIIDLSMPKKNGLEIIKELNTKIPVIFTVKYSDMDLFLEAITFNIYKFNIKPINLNKLLLNIQDSVFSGVFRTKLFEKVNLLDIIDENVLISITDKNGIIIDASSAFCKFVKYSKDELLGENHKKLRHPDTPDSFYANMWCVLNAKKVFKEEIKNLNNDGDVYWATLTITPILDEMGDVLNFIAIRQDITNKKKLEGLSIVDELTTLYNRRYFNKKIEEEIRRVKRENLNISVMCIDIDNFKKYNDCYGHPQGDSALFLISLYLKECASRASDYVFRLGGEEFCIISSGGRINESFAFMDSIVSGIEALKIEHKKSEISEYLTISAGLIVLSADKITDSKHLYTYADEALYTAKNEGRNRLVLSNKSLGY